MFNHNCYSTTLTVRSDYLQKNINFFRSKISSKTKIIAIIKANAYGYGDVNIANKLIDNNIDYF